MRWPDVRSIALRALYRAGWAAGATLPRALVDRALAAASWDAARRNGRSVQMLRRNLAVITGAPPSEELTRAAVASHLRNVYEGLALPGWSTERVVGSVTTTGEEGLRAAHADRGVVVALPHSGNWDHAGAWACQTGLPVTTVAEQLADPDFRAFTRFREGLGMEVMSHRDPQVLRRLTAAIANDRVVCLLCDRDLPGTGVPVSWAGHRVTMPAGPALVARRAGAALVPAVSTFTPSGMQLAIGAPVTTEAGPAGVRSMTQQVADYFAAAIAEAPQDWHMFQPFFGADRDRAGERR